MLKTLDDSVKRGYFKIARCDSSWSVVRCCLHCYHYKLSTIFEYWCSMLSLLSIGTSDERPPA